MFSSAENSFQESQLYLDAVIQNGREENKSQSLVEVVDRSELAEPVILIADRGYEAYNNMAHIEQKGWNYLICVKEKRGIFQDSNCLTRRNLMRLFICFSRRNLRAFVMPFFGSMC